ncbi:Imm15 family immunity protein [Serratia marcescens]|uniref:Imm15 family immunity protein n=1 Tax=Serratia marcescens TaxID=615 RepID=UPI000E2D50F2|nr:Imm15 family immunity protein [Serratia marcescens]
MNELDKQMQLLIKKEKLDDQNIFFEEYETFEEIPLFSQWSYVDFLKKYSFDKRNEILLEKSIKLTDEAMANAKLVPGLDFNEYFICVSIVDWYDIEERGCISPSIYVSRRKRWLLPLLGLREIESSEINMIKKYLINLNIKKKVICVSKSHGYENDRIYIVDECLLK